MHHTHTSEAGEKIIIPTFADAIRPTASPRSKYTAYATSTDKDGAKLQSTNCIKLASTPKRTVRNGDN